MKTIAAITMLLLTSACSDPNDYQVVVDKDFTPTQAEAVYAGMHMWEKAIPEMRLGSEERPNSVHIWTKANCPYELTLPHIGFSDGNRDICIDTVRTRPEWVARVTAHEIGHAVGALPHHAAPSIMTKDISIATPEPSSGDVADMRSMLGL